MGAKKGNLNARGKRGRPRGRGRETTVQPLPEVPPPGLQTLHLQFFRPRIPQVVCPPAQASTSTVVQPQRGEEIVDIEFETRSGDEESQEEMEGESSRSTSVDIEHVASSPVPMPSTSRNDTPLPSAARSETPVSRSDTPASRSDTPASGTPSAVSHRSALWNHFHVEVLNGEDVRKCNYCTASYSHTGGTGNMKNHVMQHHPERYNPSQLTLDRHLLLRHPEPVITSLFPFSIVL